MSDEPTQAQVDASIDGGYFLFARKAIQPGSWLMDKPSLWMKLWVWMLGRAAYQPTGKLEKGQFHTSISEMQNAMSYHIGYRKVTPTKDEIRNAYEAFTKTTMITTTKATRGMVITILNYKLYQNSKNYEAHNEAHNENSTKAHTIEKEIKKDLKTSMSNAEAIRLSQLLFDLIRTVNPKAKPPNIDAWAKHLDLAMRIDKRTPDEIEQVIRWCQKDSFWQSNILSTSKLRQKFDQLWMRMKEAKPTAKAKSSWDDLPEDPIC